MDVKILSSTTDPNTHIQTIVTNYGTLTLDTQTGKFTFDISGSDADKLAAGEELEFSFHTTVNDQNGGNADNRLDVTIRGHQRSAHARSWLNPPTATTSRS